MGKSIFHSSIEGGQHGPKGLEGFLAFAKQAGAAGAQPTCYMLENGKGGFKTAAEIKDTFAKYGLKFDGISCHCVTWVLNAAWTGSKTILPFLSSEVGKKSAPEIEQWTEDYLKKLMDLAAELKVYILPMFWGPAFASELIGLCVKGFSGFSIMSAIARVGVSALVMNSSDWESSPRLLKSLTMISGVNHSASI